MLNLKLTENAVIDNSKVADVTEKLVGFLFPFRNGKATVYEDGTTDFGITVAVKEELCIQINNAFIISGKDNCHPTCNVCDKFFNGLNGVYSSLLTDVKAFIDDDPAAENPYQIIACYPGFFAIAVYRIAHLLHLSGVPLIPRIMTEYAHGKTGIDIHPDAEIGDYFFIDHGTGVVIGQTTVIGTNVKLYQGVTLGALSVKNAQSCTGKKRHPTLKNGVTVYANATILGGNTVIGENCIIGGGTFITSSIPANTKVTLVAPEMKLVTID